MNGGIAADKVALTVAKLNRQVKVQRAYIDLLEHENERLLEYKRRTDTEPAESWWDRLAAWWKRVGP